MNSNPARLDATLRSSAYSRPKGGFFRVRAIVTGCALALIAAPGVLLAEPAPKLSAISPEWIQRGTTIDIVLTGENLGGVSGFLFDGDHVLSATNLAMAVLPKSTVTIESSGGGITRAEPAPARDQKRLVIKVTAAADASLAPRELRVFSPGGVSNPLNLNVGQWPEIAKRDPNSTLDTAQVVQLPAVIVGVLNVAAQTNLYRFKAMKGENFVFEVDAARRGSPLDSSLAVMDVTGISLVLVTCK